MIDIAGLELSPALRELVGKVRADDAFIASVRVGQNQPRTVRLVVDLKQVTAPQVFRLSPVAAYQHRLVFDLYPTKALDPLQALPREKMQAEEQAARSVQDALGEFIDRMEHPGIPKIPPWPPQAAAAPTPAPAPSSPPMTSAPLPPPTAEQLKKMDRLIIVALDPGHGGEDPGAIGPSGLREKDVVLAVALQLRERLNASPACAPCSRATLTSLSRCVSA